MDCREEYESFKLDTSLDRLKLLGFSERCLLEAPDLAMKARERCEELDALMKQDWAETKDTDAAKAYKKFLKKWPDSTYSDEAKREIEKRYELFTALITKKNEDGVRIARWQFLLLLGPPFLFAIGIGGLLLLGLTALALPLVGLSPDISTAFPTLAVVLLLVFKFGFGSESLEAFSGVFIISALSALVVIILNWIGLGGWTSSFMQASGL